MFANLHLNFIPSLDFLSKLTDQLTSIDAITRDTAAKCLAKSVCHLGGLLPDWAWQIYKEILKILQMKYQLEFLINLAQIEILLHLLINLIFFGQLFCI